MFLNEVTIGYESFEKFVDAFELHERFHGEKGEYFRNQFFGEEQRCPRHHSLPFKLNPS
jgi:hypothetical protein